MANTTKVNTPLAQVLRHLGLTQEALAGRLGVAPARVSKLARRVPRPEMAQRILEALPEARAYVTEIHLLYPERFKEWQLTAENKADVPPSS